MRGLEDEIALLNPKTAPAVLAAAERFMARTDEISEMIAEMIEALAADPFFRPPFVTITSDINTGLLLYGDADVTIALGVTSADALAAKKTAVRDSTSIIFTGHLSSFRWLKGGGATLSFWEAPPAGPNFVASERRSCRFVERRRLEDGERFVMDGSRQSFVIEHAVSDMVCLQAVVLADSAPVAVGYDSTTLAFSGASSTDEASSRTEMMVSLLRLLDRGDAVPELAELLDSPHFYTRWHVMREFLAMDAEAALPHLKRLAGSDPHPEVRAAAAETLKMFFAEEEEVHCPA